MNIDPTTAANLKAALAAEQAAEQEHAALEHLRRQNKWTKSAAAARKAAIASEKLVAALRNAGFDMSLPYSKVVEIINAL